MTKHWTIVPYTSVGLLKLGMSVKEVSKFNSTIGKPEIREGGLREILSKVEEKYPEGKKLVEGGFDFEKLEESTTELRDAVLCDYFGGRLSTITLRADGPVSVFLEDVNLFDTDTVHLLQTLERANGGALVSASGVFFNKLSIMLGSYYSQYQKTFYESDEQDDRNVGVYSHDAIARLRAIPIMKFEPISFLFQTD